MVEGLVVIPFFMIIFAATMLMGGLYAKRIHLQNDAREAAWQEAVSENCDGVVPMADLEIVDSSDLGELASSPMAALCNAEFGSVKAQPKASFEIGGPITFGGAKNIAALAIVPCNETPVAGDVAYEHAIEFLWAAYQSNGDVPPDASPATSINVSNLVFGNPIYKGSVPLAL